MVDSSFCSNFARKEATPLGEIPAVDMTETSDTISKCSTQLWLRGQVGSEAWLGRAAEACLEAWNVYKWDGLTIVVL